MAPLALRPGTPADSAAAGDVCYRAFRDIAGRHGFPPDFPSADVAAGLAAMLFARPGVTTFVAEDEGRVLGSNFLWEDPPVGGIGPITIDPEVQNAGLGRRLMEAALARAATAGLASVRLVQAAYHGRSLSLYAKLGFEVREPLLTLQGPAPARATAGWPVRAATPADAEACDALCLAVHGHVRSGELRLAIQDGTATVVEHGGRIAGYATLLGFLGHAVAESDDALRALIAAAREFQGPGFLLPARQSGLLRWCLAEGLRIVQPMTLMTRGLYSEPRGAWLPSILY